MNSIPSNPEGAPVAPSGGGNPTQFSAAAIHHLRLYSVERRGGGGRRDRSTLCHGDIHHARHRTCSERCRHRLLLLAAVHARRLRISLLRGAIGRSRRLSQRRGGDRRAHRRRPRRRRELWRSDRSPSRPSAYRSSAPRSGCFMPDRPRSPATMRPLDSRKSACRPKPGVKSSPSSAPCWSAARHGRACFCSSLPPSGKTLQRVRLIVRSRSRPTADEPARHRRRVGVRGVEARIVRVARTSRPSLERSGLPTASEPTGRPFRGSAVVRTDARNMRPSFLCARVSFPSPGRPDHLCAALDVGHVTSLEDAVRHPDHTASQWLDLAEGRLRLDRLRRNGVGETFFPCRPSRHSSRGKKLSPPPSSAALRPATGCVVDRLRLSDRHRGRGGRGLETAKEK